MGEEKAYKYVFETHYPLMCHLAHTILQDEYLSQMIAGDVISHLFEVKDSLEIHTSLRSFLLTSVRNACINHKGTKLYRTELSFSTLSTQNMSTVVGGSTTSSPLGILLERETESKIEKAIEDLPETTRRIFCQSRFEGKNYQEIADSEGVSINAIKYHMKRSLKSLRESLDYNLLN